MSNNNQYDIDKDLRYLTLLSHSFPNVAEASTEIINLQAILNLPKGTEHFLADLHGEFAAFQHVLKNASGNIKRKVNEIFGNEIRDAIKRDLCTLIYYPEQKLEVVKSEEEDIDEWYSVMIYRLVRVCRDVSSKYTRSKVRKALPADFAYVIEELLHERTDDHDKAAYVESIIESIVSTGRSDDFIIAICHVIQRLVIDKLHILGDIFDRGRVHISFSTCSKAIKTGISNGATTTFYGWVLPQVTTHVSATSFASLSAMPISLPSRKATASTSCHWPHSQWRPTRTTPARYSFRKQVAVQRKWMPRVHG